MSVSIFTNLHPCFSKVNLHGNLFSGIDIWIVCFLESAFKLFQLGRCECRPDPPLLAFLGENSIVAGIYFIRKSTCKPSSFRDKR